jgi:hypothetical protein
MEYIPGKDNVAADFLSRTETTNLNNDDNIEPSQIAGFETDSDFHTNAIEHNNDDSINSSQASANEINSAIKLDDSVKSPQIAANKIDPNLESETIDDRFLVDCVDPNLEDEFEAIEDSDEKLGEDECEEIIDPIEEIAGNDKLMVELQADDAFCIAIF